MKKSNLLISFLSLINLCSCGGNMSSSVNENISSTSSITSSMTSSSKIEENEYIVSSVEKLDDNKTYLKVDGHPFAIRGAQIRIDGLLNRNPAFEKDYPSLTKEELDQYFKAAKDCNLNTVEISLDWKRIEIEKDVFDYSLVDTLLELTNKYDLKCEFLWFSTNMCGDSHGFHIPDYIINDPTTYSRFESEKETYSNMYGKMFWLILNDEDLMERETLVLSKIMEHVYEWNLENGKKNPLIGIQVHNESDGLLRWRLFQKELKLNGEAVTPEYLWNVTLEALDNAGKAIKNSKYKIYTRCNMTVTYGIGEFPQYSKKGFSPIDVLRLEGIDMVGDDPYTENPSMINSTIREYSVEGNYPHIAENMGNYAASSLLFLSAYQAGGSYMFYDLATPQYFVFLNGNNTYQMDQGLLRPDFSYKPHTEETIRIIKGVAKMGSVLPLVNSEDFAAYNINKLAALENVNQTICTSNLKINYNNSNSGIGYAIEHDGYAYLYSTSNANFIIENASFTFKAEIGYFNNDEFIVEDTTIVNPTIEVEKEKLYRIKIRNIDEQVESTTNENV